MKSFVGSSLAPRLDVARFVSYRRDFVSSGNLAIGEPLPKRSMASELAAVNPEENVWYRGPRVRGRDGVLE